MGDSIFEALNYKKGTFLTPQKYTPVYIEEESPPPEASFKQKTHISDYPNAIENYGGMSVNIYKWGFIVIIVILLLLVYLTVSNNPSQFIYIAKMYTDSAVDV